MKNDFGKPLEGKIERVEDILDYLEDKDCFINIDRSWFYWKRGEKVAFIAQKLNRSL